MISIRPTGPADAPLLAALQQKAFLPLYEVYEDPGSPALRGEEDILVRLASPELYFYYNILLDKELVGGIFYSRRSETAYYHHRVYVSPEVQAKGIASTAILLCEQELPEAKQFTVDFPVDRVMNQRCYEKAGYTDTSRRQKINEKLTLAFYEKLK